MNLNDLTQPAIEDLVIRGGDLSALYRIDVWLQERRSKLFIDLARENDRDAKMTIKKNLGWAENLHDICKRREDDLKENNDAFNWRFRVEAQKVLSTEQYNKIAEQAKHRP